jgi:uncharacterized protein (TIGR03066 family)
VRKLVACVGVLCVILLASAAPVPKERAEADKVVGTWKLVKSSHALPAGKTVSLEMELASGGKMTLRQSDNGGPVFAYEGEYSVDKKELLYFIKRAGGIIMRETLTIKKITDNEFIVVDGDGVQEEFERVKVKKTEETKPEKPRQ